MSAMRAAQPGLPTVDVIIPAYNAARYIEETIASVAAQTCLPASLIVVDDGSTDETPALLARLQADLPTGWLRVLRQPNAGLSAARNAGISAASAPYVAFLDADDLWVPEKLQAQLELLREGGPQAPGLIYCDYEHVDEDGRPVTGPRFMLDTSVRGEAKGRLKDANCIAGSGSAVLIRRELFNQVGGFDTSMRSAEDWDMWLRLAQVTTFDFVPAPLVKIRRHRMSMQADPRRMLDGELVLFAKQCTRGTRSSVHLARLRRLVALHRLDVRTLPSAATHQEAVLRLFEGRAFRLWCAAYRMTLAARRRAKEWLGRVR